MKHIFTSLVVFCAATAMACGIHQFKMPLNQRGFYNPSALCPYCKGSTFFATGAFAGIHSNEFGMFATIGNDGENSLHGAWDLTYAHGSTDYTSTTSFSSRYAWKQPIGSWMMAAGVRASYINYSQLFTSGWTCIPEVEVARAKTSFWNFDAGMTITNQKGFYAGVSVLNLSEPTINMQYELLGVTNTYRQQSMRTYVAGIGGLVNLGQHFDLMLDVDASKAPGMSCVHPSAMIRFNHKLALGTAVTAGTGENPVPEIQAGFTTTPFKWLTSVAFAQTGPVIETGIVVRFGVQRWRVTKLPQPCVNIPTPEPPQTEFSPNE